MLKFQYLRVELLLKSTFTNSLVFNPFFIEIAYASSAAGTMSFLLDRWALGTDPNYQNKSVQYLHHFYTVDELLTNTLLCWLTRSTPRILELFTQTALNSLSAEMFR